MDSNMPIFAQGVPKDKLTLLYYASVSELELTRDQLYRAMVENDCMSYFDYQTDMNELEEDGFVAAIPRAFGQGYRITVRGEEMLKMFAESLPKSLRTRLKQYADENREQMRIETHLVSSMEEQSDGSYTVTLKAQEKNTVELEITMRVVSREMAKRIRSNWPDASEPIYQTMTEQLLK